VGRRCDLSEEELAAIWYSRDEFRAIKKMLIPTVKKMAKGIPLDDDEDSRGLEHKTPHGSRKRQGDRFLSMDAVLQEQDQQWEQNRRDPDFLARVYSQSSAHCLMQSHLVAKGDAENVEKLTNGSASDEHSGASKRALSSQPRATPTQCFADLSPLRSPRVLSMAA
jgi:hypothetical protein